MSILSKISKFDLRRESNSGSRFRFHIMSTISRLSSTFQSVDLVPPDIQFDVTRRYLTDPKEGKINLGQGTYRDENGLPWVLPSIQMAKKSLGEINHEYLPIAGFQPFLTEATKLLFAGTEALAEERVSSFPLLIFYCSN